MHSQNKYQAKDSQSFTKERLRNKKGTEQWWQGTIPRQHYFCTNNNISKCDEDVNEEIDERLREEEEHYAFWLWEMFNKRK